MTGSAFIAFIFGVYVLVVSLRMLFNPAEIKDTMNRFVEDRPLIFLTGVLAIFGGSAIIWFHNIWVQEWPVIITILGWIALIEGILMIVAPVSLTRLARIMLKSDKLVQLLGLIYLPIGAYMLWCAWPYMPVR